MSVNAKDGSAQQAAAQTFFTWWNSKSSQIYYAVHTGFVPTNTSVTASDLKANPDVADFQSVSKSAQAYNLGTQYTNIETNTWEPAIEKILQGCLGQLHAERREHPDQRLPGRVSGCLIDSGDAAGRARGTDHRSVRHALAPAARPHRVHVHAAQPGRHGRVHVLSADPRGHLVRSPTTRSSARPSTSGLANYTSLVQSHQFWGDLGNTGYYAAVTTPVSMVLALALALLLNRRQLPGRGMLRAAIFLPAVVSLAVAAIPFRLLFTPSIGLITYWLGSIGVHSSDWLDSTTLAMPAVIIVGIWKNVGFYMVIYLAGLQTIPPESTRRPGSTAPRPGSGSATSPGRC